MTDISKSIGRTFLLVGFLPALVLVVLNSAVIVPLLPTLGNFMSQPILGLDGGFYILIPLAIGSLLTALAEPLTLLYEGVFDFERTFLLKPLMKHNERNHDKLYSDLVALKQAYVREDDEHKRQSLERAIGQEHAKLFETRRTDTLPYDKRRLLPTRLGNTWAAIEEYPAYRYGMDGVTFWPRLRACIPKEYLETIDGESVYMRFLLNLSFVSACFALESVIVVLTQHSPTINSVTAFAVGVGCLLIAHLAYRGCVTVTRSLGELIKSSFDLYRGELLAELGIEWKPKTRLEERRIWIGIARYLVTGENTYWPETHADIVKSIDVAQPSGITSPYWTLAHIDMTMAEYGGNVPWDVLMGVLEVEQSTRNRDRCDSTCSGTRSTT